MRPSEDRGYGTGEVDFCEFIRHWKAAFFLPWELLGWAWATRCFSTTCVLVNTVVTVRLGVCQ